MQNGRDILAAFNMIIILPVVSQFLNINDYRQSDPNIGKHDWLPNQPNHFKHVRCIECHAEQNDSLMVSHNIQPKSKAVKKCQECHSTNSKLMASLYKYQLQSKGRFRLNNEAFKQNPVLIGGKRNVSLKLIGNIALVLP